MNHSMIEVVFKVTAALRLGEEIRVSGNSPMLGKNDHALSIPLTTSGHDYPWWTTKSLFLSGDAGAVAYRYCVFCGGKFSRWEGNFFRTLDHRQEESMVVTNDIYGTPSTNNTAGDTGAMMSSDGRASIVTASKVRTFKARQFEEWGRKVLMDKSVSPADCAIIVSYFLPVILRKTTDDRWTATWDDEALLAMQTTVKFARIGSVRWNGGPIPVEEEDAVAQVLLELNCFPVFITQSMHHQFYDVYCKKTIWPILHHVADVYGTQSRSDDSAQAQQDIWFTYTTINRLFRDKVVEIYQRGDLIWIHGFHLLLLPSFLRRVLPLSKIGLFFHTPFPSSEIWKTMNRREELLRGILGADHVGFHLYEYARHFLTTCHRLLGHTYEMSPSGSLVVNADGRVVGITCMHVGIDLPKVQNALASPEFGQEYEQWRNRFPNKVVVAGIDRLERLKGIPLKLQAIEQFMEENPKWLRKIVFAIIGVSARERGEDYRQTQRDVKTLVDRINAKFGSQQGGDLVYFEEREDNEIHLRKRLAFFAASDVFLISSTRDGLNRMPMEFTLARSSNPPSDVRIEGGGLATEGLLIISEFVSSARVMRGGLMINPWRADEVKGALKRVLEMERTERCDRMRRNLEFSTRLTTANWTLQVLQDLKSVEKSDDMSSYSAMGFGMGFKVMGVKSGFEPVDTSKLTKSYRNSTNRLIILDWGGTLVTETDKIDKLQAYAIAQGNASRIGPTAALKETLETLCADPRNTVFVVSGKEIKNVQEFFGDVAGLGLGAEHGFYYRWPHIDGRLDPIHDQTSPTVWSLAHSGRPFSPPPLERSVPNSAASTPGSHVSKWQSMMPLGDQSWRESALMVMDIYVQRTHGTYIERKGNALIWKFHDADPEFGFMQSKELEEHLQAIMAPDEVEILRGGGVSDGYIEVRPSGVSKGLFLEHALTSLKSIYDNVDFLLAIGDDASDEPMFEQILRLENQDSLSAFGITVGKKPSMAQSYVDDPGAVMDLLLMLIKTASRDKKYFSSVDLSNHASYRSASPEVKALQKSSSHNSFGQAKLTEKDQRAEIVPLRTPSNESTFIPRSNSLCDMTMKEYLDHINDDVEEDEDGAGLYF